MDVFSVQEFPEKRYDWNFLILSDKKIPLNLTSLVVWYYDALKPGDSVGQVMTCRLFSAKPLSDPMLIYCQFDIKE